LKLIVLYAQGGAEPDSITVHALPEQPEEQDPEPDIPRSRLRSCLTSIIARCHPLKKCCDMYITDKHCSQPQAWRVWSNIV